MPCGFFLNALIQHLANKSTRAAVRTPQSESSSLAEHQLTCTAHSCLVQICVYAETCACNQCAEMKLCIQVPEPTVTFKIVLKNHMYINIYKQQRAENTL